MKKIDVKKIIALFSAVCLFVLTLSLYGCGGGEKEKKELVILNYGEYMAEGVIAQFEQETGYTVVYDEYESPEDMYAKLSAGAAEYDAICSTDYMVEKMIKEGLALELDYDAMPETKNILDDCWNYSKAFDPQLKYTVPHFWGTVGIIYDSAKVTDAEASTWETLWDKKFEGKIIMFNSVRDSFIPALKLNNFSLNTKDEAQIRAAQEMLIEQKPIVQAYLYDEIKDEMMAGNAEMAMIYSGDAATAMEGNSALKYCVPSEGSNVWVDSWFVPSTCKDKTGAELFINFLCRKDIAEKNFEQWHYATPNKAVYDMQPAEIKNDPLIFPAAETLSRCETMGAPTPEMEELYSTLWKEIKGS